MKNEQLRKELQKAGFKSSEPIKIKREKDQYPDIDVFDKEVIEDLSTTIQGLGKTRYRRNKTRFIHQNKPGEVTILNVRKIMQKVNENSQSYLALKALYSDENKAFTTKEVFDKVLKENSASRANSVSAYLGQYVKIGLAKKSMNAGITYYQAENLNRDEAYIKYLTHTANRPKKPSSSQSQSVDQQSSIHKKRITGEQNISDKIADKVIEKLAARILVEVAGNIHVIFKFGG